MILLLDIGIASCVGSWLPCRSTRTPTSAAEPAPGGQRSGRWAKRLDPQLQRMIRDVAPRERSRHQGPWPASIDRCPIPFMSRRMEALRVPRDRAADSRLHLRRDCRSFSRHL